MFSRAIGYVDSDCDIYIHFFQLFYCWVVLSILSLWRFLDRIQGQLVTGEKRSSRRNFLSMSLQGARYRDRRDLKLIVSRKNGNFAATEALRWKDERALENLTLIQIMAPCLVILIKKFGEKTQIPFYCQTMIWILWTIAFISNVMGFESYFTRKKNGRKMRKQSGGTLNLISKWHKWKLMAVIF